MYMSQFRSVVPPVGREKWRESDDINIDLAQYEYMILYKNTTASKDGNSESLK